MQIKKKNFLYITLNKQKLNLYKFMIKIGSISTRYDDLNHLNLSLSRY